MKMLLQFGALLHFVILLASALVPRVLDWRGHLALLPPLLRRLFWVYGAFIVLVIAGFGVITLSHAEVLAAGGSLARVVCGFIAIFWCARLAVQFFVFDARPFLTTGFLRVGYYALTVIFTMLAAIFALAALRPGLEVLR